MFERNIPPGLATAHRTGRLGQALKRYVPVHHDGQFNELMARVARLDETRDPLQRSVPTCE